MSDYNGRDRAVNPRSDTFPTRLASNAATPGVRRFEPSNQAGVPRRIAMKISGHKTESVYLRYAIASEKGLVIAAEHLNRHHAATDQVGLHKKLHMADDQTRAGAQLIKKIGAEGGS